MALSGNSATSDPSDRSTAVCRTARTPARPGDTPVCRPQVLAPSRVVVSPKSLGKTPSEVADTG